MDLLQIQDKLADTKWLSRSRSPKYNRQYGGRKKWQKVKQQSAKYYTEGKKMSDTNLTKTRVWTCVLRNDQQFQLY